MAVNEYLSPQELAELIGVPVSTIYGMNCAGSGPRRIRIGKHVRYRRDWVDSWIAGLVVDDDRDQARRMNS